MTDQEFLNAIGEMLDQKLLPINRRLEAVEERLEALEKRVEALEHRMEAVEERLKVVENRLEVVDNRLDVLEQQSKSVCWQVTSIGLTLENELRPNIMRIAEGHFDLNRKLEQAMDSDKEREILALKVNYLDGEVRKLIGKM